MSLSSAARLGAQAGLRKHRLLRPLGTNHKATLGRPPQQRRETHVRQPATGTMSLGGQGRCVTPPLKPLTGLPRGIVTITCVPGITCLGTQDLAYPTMHPAPHQTLRGQERPVMIPTRPLHALPQRLQGQGQFFCGGEKE